MGLNTALYLAETTTHDIFLLEQEKFLGHHTSTRNSEVIHAGFAYPPESLKAKLCVEGNKLTYELLERLHVPYKKCGKWVIACNDAEDKALINAEENARACGVKGFKGSKVQRFYNAEPDAHGVTAVAFSESSGIMDASSYIRALEVALSSKPRVQIVYPCKVTNIDSTKSTLETARGPIQYDILINSAGLWSDDVYKMCGGKIKFEIVPFKGEYYTWRKGRVQTMIYPVPRRFMPASKTDQTLISSMGIHMHRNIAGELFVGPSQVKSSPDKKDDYTIQTPPEVFAEAVSHFIKGLSAKDLEPAYAGNRPKLYKAGNPIGDFEIFKDGNIIHLLGMESPALTAAPAIARHVSALVFAGPA